MVVCKRADINQIHEKMENCICDKSYELELTHVSSYGNSDLIREIRKNLSLNLKDS